MAIDLRCGRWQTALADISAVDALICDPPYSARTHSKQKHGRRSQVASDGDYVSARGLGYRPLRPGDVYELVQHWGPRTAGWFVAFTDSELYPVWRDALREQGRTVFAPLPCVQIGMNVRLAGDGPSSWTTWLIVARPRALSRWGTLPGAYIGNPFDAGENSSSGFRRGTVVGSKPLWLMRAIVADYSAPGDLICDPFAGGGTTLLAALTSHRRALGAELDPHTHAMACERIERRLEALPMERLYRVGEAVAENDNGGPHGAA